MHDLLRKLWQRPIMYGSLISVLTFTPLSIDQVIAQEAQQETQIPHDHSEEFYVKTYGNDIASLKAELKQHPTSKGYVKLSDAYFEHNQLKKAAEAARQAIKIDPNNWEGYHDLGTMLTGLGDLDGAWEKYNTALRLSPNNPTPYSGLAEVALRKGDPTMAISLIQKALTITPEDPNLLIRLKNYITYTK